MTLSSLVAKWKQFVGNMNDKGIPVPLLRYKKEGNPAFTLLGISTILIVVGIVGKWSGKLGGIDMANAMQFFTTSVALFFGHSWVSQTTTEPDGKKKELDLKTGNTNPSIDKPIDHPQVSHPG